MAFQAGQRLPRKAVQSLVEYHDGMFASPARVVILECFMVVSKGVKGLDGNLLLSVQLSKPLGISTHRVKVDFIVSVALAMKL